MASKQGTLNVRFSKEEHQILKEVQESGNFATAGATVRYLVRIGADHFQQRDPDTWMAIQKSAQTAAYSRVMRAIMTAVSESLDNGEK